MGITIHYKGKLDHPGLTDTIIEELADISTEMDWKYNAFDRGDDGLRGLVIGPHEKSEPLSFLFDDDGNVYDVKSVVAFGKEESKTSFVSVKTQFAPVEIHAVIIKLLKYIKKKYISNLDVIDEGMYWETEDLGLLEQKIAFLNEMMDAVEGVLRNIKVDKGESEESVIAKIEKVLKEKFIAQVEAVKRKK
jgi:hypothetical protein